MSTQDTGTGTRACACGFGWNKLYKKQYKLIIFHFILKQVHRQDSASHKMALITATGSRPPNTRFAADQYGFSQLQPRSGWLRRMTSDEADEELRADELCDARRDARCDAQRDERLLPSFHSSTAPGVLSTQDGVTATCDYLRRTHTRLQVVHKKTLNKNAA